ncbi:unnamed protein product [Blumeria hordei]|uniref:Uncharacterized protein n=1 Tax=Blumeria hordei TaxID=2867405 RepID=A0A383UL28_BLUHO|nr:unnamed protein product [Blumeria hordei]
MKSLLAVAGTIISYSVYTRAYPRHGTNYYCGKKIIESEIVERGKSDACLSLSGSPWWVEFPASLDGSKIFGIVDATLFSWPLYWQSVNEVAGRKAGNLRVIIDSTCRLIGVLNRIDNTYQKCIQPLNPNSISTSLELSLRNPIKTYGIDCNGFIFFEEELDGAYDSLHRYFVAGAISDQSKEPNGSLQSHILSEFGNEMIWSWPVQFVMEKKTYESTRKILFRATINRFGNKMGMIYKTEDSWRRCSVISYMDKIQKTAIKKHKTAVDKELLYEDNDFQCGDQIINAITINSHLRAACPRVWALVKSGNMNEYLYPWSLSGLSHNSNLIWYWPIRKPELSNGQELDNSKHQLISLGNKCEFLGVYYLVDDRRTECRKLNKSLLSLELRTKSANLELNPLKRKYINFA